MIGFAGPRVIEQTIRQKLPEGFQRSEYLLDKGMVDMVVDRRKLKTTIGDPALRVDAQARGGPGRRRRRPISSKPLSKLPKVARKQQASSCAASRESGGSRRVSGERSGFSRDLSTCSGGIRPRQTDSI